MLAISHDHDISRFPIPAILDDCDDPLDCDGRIAIAILHAFSSSRLRAISCAWIATSYARDDDIINRRTITTTAINPNICKALLCNPSEAIWTQLDATETEGKQTVLSDIERS